ncbi:Leucine Rich Repeat [Seminavis robusta]|uniref:Leucine Rich Repeat n=1 Tax=Seminavis robusta TaxID=568900 RepID=A0A9N8EJ51_9STRA|nr:Leucine Rich Repeat [Seminavis robusta]|eukprot:Sro1324_g262770.1 Leucine Rich Repeat (744) ;mRNA; f:10000-12231
MNLRRLSLTRFVDSLESEKFIDPRSFEEMERKTMEEKQGAEKTIASGGRPSGMRSVEVEEQLAALLRQKQYLEQQVAALLQYISNGDDQGSVTSGASTFYSSVGNEDCNRTMSDHQGIVEPPFNDDPPKGKRKISAEHLIFKNEPNDFASGIWSVTQANDKKDAKLAQRHGSNFSQQKESDDRMVIKHSVTAATADTTNSEDSHGNRQERQEETPAYLQWFPMDGAGDKGESTTSKTNKEDDGFSFKPWGAEVGGFATSKAAPTSDHDVHDKTPLLEYLASKAQRSSTGGETSDSSSTPHSSNNKPYISVDDGDEKVSSKRSRRKGTDCRRVEIPSRDVDQDPCLIKIKKKSSKRIGCDPQEALLEEGRSQRKSKRNLRAERKPQLSCLTVYLVSMSLVMGVCAALIIYFCWDDVVEARNSSANSVVYPTLLDLDSFYNDTMPMYAKLAMQENSFSPQSRAFHWLENEEQMLTLSALEALQKFVLASLFYSTNGHFWKKSGDWMDHDRSECQWYTHEFSSVCDSAGQLHTLSLPDNSLQGTLPEELALLSHLNIVQLQNNHLNGILPSRFWSSWDHLVFLNLYNNSLSGTIPPDVKHLAKAKRLNTLSLRSNDFSGSLPSEIGLLHVQFLSLSRNRFWGPIPTEIGQLSNAKDLYLYNNQFFGTIPTTLGLLTRLTSLELHNNELIGRVPREVCDLWIKGRLKRLTVDCDLVRCSCACDCSATTDRLIGDSLLEHEYGANLWP